MGVREHSVMRQMDAAPAPPLLQRRCACHQDEEPAEGTLRRSRTGREGGWAAPRAVHQTLAGPGRPLEPSVRRLFESGFSHDFSSVRIHTDGQAAHSAGAVSAAAYTVGNRIVFGAGQYAPDTKQGRRLLAHELTHTMQQGGGAAPLPGRLTVGAPDSAYEHEADAAAERLGAHPVTAGAQMAVQRDLARPPTGAAAAPVVLTPSEIAAAIAFNQQRFRDPYSIALIRDVIGLDRFPATVDEEFVEAIREWQAERRMTQDGQVGHTSTRSIFLELVAEGQFRDAVALLIDSYALPASPNLINIRVGTGLNCCRTATVAVADAVTFDAGGGNGRSICVCRTSIPQSAAGYDHFVRILLHELVHVPQRAAGPANGDAREFDAFFAETCAGGRAPMLSAAERVAHARAAINHFNAMPAAFQTPARIANRDRLNALITAGGVGPC